MAKNWVTVMGSFVADLAFRVERKPEWGETLMGPSFALGPGGKGSNQAVAAARAGGDQAGHDRLIAEAVRAATADAGADVIVLAQASMAAAAESAGVAIPVLTSPAGGVALLAETLTPSDPGRPDASANRPAAPGSGGTTDTENGASS